jgi:hypothetical protein
MIHSDRYRQEVLDKDLHARRKVSAH